jgi:hypothetical protein
MSSVRLLTPRRVPAEGVVCLALAHNEADKVEDFLRHHRELGVVHFFIVDDNSTDSTAEYLQSQRDVTLFVPDGTNYREHKVRWRSDILDSHAVGRWVLLPDMDELFVYPFCDRSDIGRLTDCLDREGAQAVFAPMVEMYADAPLDRRIYQPGESMLETYPFFDTDGYRLISGKGKYLKRYPTPPLDMYGGPRERLFYDFGQHKLSAARRWGLARFGHLGRSMMPTAPERAGNLLARLAISRKAPRPPLLMSKIGLLKWRKGLRFSGGPHAISESSKLSNVWGALLHFKFIDLPREIAYRTQRQQHAGGAVHYKKLALKGGFDRSPIYEGSRRYNSWRDLADCGLLRSTATWNDAVVEPHLLAAE